MSQPLLSILIPTVVGREYDFERLFFRLKSQVSDEMLLQGSIEYRILKDNKEMTIGEKREKLYHQAQGLYSVQWDDDDDISSFGLKWIFEALIHQPDCVTYREKCMINGQYYSSNHSLKYDGWADKQDGFDYVRTPFYKDVIKTEIARSIPFEHIRYGEDHAWSMALKPNLRNEYHIDEEIYYYIHNSKPEDHNDRYGII